MTQKCFIIMPFSKTRTTTKDEWTKIYLDLFQPIWKEYGFHCERIGIARGSITKEIIEKLFSADIVFADITDTNPNVMYELGIRHVFRKPSLMVKRKGTKIPFDVRDYIVHEYQNTATGMKELKQIIKDVIEDINKNPEKPDNPVWDFLQTGKFMIDYYSNIQSLNKLQSLIEELSNNLDLWTTINNDVESKSDNDDVTNFKVLLLQRMDCLILLMTTRYVSFDSTEWEKILSLYIALSRLRSLSGAISDPWFSSVKKKDFCNMFQPALTVGLFRNCITIISKRIEELSPK